MSVTLRQYLLVNKKTATQFAGEIGVTHSAVVKWLQGKCTPRKVVMTRIREVTGGTVTADSFLSESEAATPPP